MSSCFNGDWHARQLQWTVVVLAMLACGRAAAQSVDNQPFVNEVVSQPITDSVVSNRTTNGGTPLRLWHRTEGYGLEASETAIGGRGAFDFGGAVAFTDGQFRISNESRFGANVGGGVRWYGSDFLVGQPRIFGVSGWYDGQETVLNNYFNQGGVSFESLGEYIDFRLNANIPFEDEKAGDMMFITGDLNFSGNSLAQATLIPTDVALRVVDFEVAPRVFDLNLWVYGGGYQMDGNGISEMGAKVGFRGYLTNDLAVDVGVTDDEEFHTNTMFQVIWTPGRTGAGPTSWIHNLADRMREPVYRNTYIATQRVDVEGSMALTDAAGDEFDIVHVDSNAAPDGDGTFERPFDELTDIQGGTDQGDIILVHANSDFSGETAVITNEQRLLGEGGGNTHTITTSQLGTVTIPETFAGALSADRPEINNVGADSVVLSQTPDDASTFTAIEVSNFDFFGGDNAISTSTGVGAVNINRVAIDGTASHAIFLTELTETLTSGTRSRFSPTIDDVTFTNVGGDDIRLDATTAETNIVQSVAISDIQSDDGEGVGINLIGLSRAGTIQNFNWNGGASGDGALRIANSGAQGDVTMSGTNVMTGGQTGTPDTLGYAINLVSNAGDLTVNGTGTTIEDMGGDSVIVSGGAGGLTFTGNIEQSVNAASILSVSGGHTGTLTFTERVPDQGVIQARTGDGLQFNNADGTYTFNDEVEILGVGTDTATAAVTVVNGSDATLTFANADFRDTDGTTITFTGGDASMTLNGKITQGQNQTVLSVTGGHDGTLVFNDLAANPGVISATNGAGLVFNDADGAYTFNDEVALSTTAHVDVSNGSTGTFTFADGDIDTTGTTSAVVIDGSSAIFTYTGDIDSVDADAVVLTDNTGGSVTFNSTIDSADEGILVQGNSGGTFLFADAVTLNGTGNGLRILQNTGANVTFSDTITSDLEVLIQQNSAGTFAFNGQVTLTGTTNGVNILNNTGGTTTFSNIDITKTGTGTGFRAVSAATGHTVTVTGTGNTISTQSGIALELDTIAAGGAGINFQSVSSNGAANGIIIDNVTGGPVNIGANAAAGMGGTIANSTNAAVQITDANVNLNNMAITGTAAGFNSVTVNQTNAVVSNVSITNSTITGGLEGIDYNRSGTATTRLTLTGNTITGTAGDAVNMNVSGGGQANITVANNTNIDGGANQALQLTVTGGLNKDVRLLANNNNMDNNSTAATVELDMNGVGTLNATVLDNDLTNTNAATGRAFDAASTSGIVRLNLRDNEAITGNATPEYLLTEGVGSDFNVQEVANVDANNIGDVEFQPNQAAFDDDAGPIPTPQ